jgi:hypothetical protein
VPNWVLALLVPVLGIVGGAAGSWLRDKNTTKRDLRLAARLLEDELMSFAVKFAWLKARWGRAVIEGQTQLQAMEQTQRVLLGLVPGPDRDERAEEHEQERVALMRKISETTDAIASELPACLPERTDRWEECSRTLARSLKSEQQWEAISALYSNISFARLLPSLISLEDTRFAGSGWSFVFMRFFTRVDEAMDQLARIRGHSKSRYWELTQDVDKFYTHMSTDRVSFEILSGGSPANDDAETRSKGDSQV